MIGTLDGRTGLEISFPPHGGKWGTCDFMTPTCSKECKMEQTKKDIDSYIFFKNSSVRIIASRLLKEVKSSNSTILSWFVSSGDCPGKLTDKISGVIKIISENGIPQNGFTRNRNFWERANSIDNVVVCLTTEKKIDGLFPIAIPDYKTWKVDIIKKNQEFLCGGGTVNRCGGGYFNEIHPEDCSLCHKEKIGCFD